MSKIIILAIVCVVVIMQFIRPDRNYTGQDSEQGMAQLYHAPNGIRSILQQSCMDCHSNNTKYPWYVELQPIGWLLNNHIQKGKEELNLDEFASYSERRRISKLKSMKNQIRDSEMPLPSYTWLHKEARLSKLQKTQLINWLDKLVDSLNQ